MVTTKKVQLPLEKIDVCFECRKAQSDTVRLRLCNSCVEALYCSEGCQRKAWPAHKAVCGHRKNDRIDLKAFYPFLAYLAEFIRFNQTVPTHPAILHKIVNSPNPSAAATVFPDRSAAKLIILGQPFTRTAGDTELTDWWPSAESNDTRSRMYRRILHEGHHLPILTSVCVGLLREMYTTTLDGSTGHRIRLQCGKYPISDFGIAKGKAKVADHNKFAYIYPDGTFGKGQDPDNHYWIYFTSLMGHKFALDTGMFSFGLGIHIHGGEYLDDIFSPGPSPHRMAPCHFWDGQQACGLSGVLTADREFSVLRNKEFQKAVESPTLDWSAIFRFIRVVSGNNCTAIEERLIKIACANSCMAHARIIESRAWERWPTRPSASIEGDPGTVARTPPRGDEFWKHAEKWMRKLKRGETTVENLAHKLDAYNARTSKASGQMKP